MFGGHGEFEGPASLAWKNEDLEARSTCSSFLPPHCKDQVWQFTLHEKGHMNECFEV